MHRSRPHPDVDRAVAAARDAFEHGPWPRTAPETRADALVAMAEYLAERARPLAELNIDEAGVPITFAHARELGPVAVFGFFEQLTRAFPLPRGAAGRAGAGVGRARTGRCDRRGGAVQRPDHVGRGQARAGAGVGVPDRVQARDRDAARRVRARRGGRGRRHPARRGEHRARRGRRRRGAGRATTASTASSSPAAPPPAAPSRMRAPGRSSE